ncbi:unnamed protein product [Cochlearia groenlandica]
MGKFTSSKLVDLLFVILILCILLVRIESALSSHHEPLSITGRRMMSYYKLEDESSRPVRPSTSQQGGGADQDGDNPPVG